MKKKVNTSTDANNGDLPKQKERHIVSWSQEEDDILREQIRLHGTENWTIIASKFKDKTTRQCRRRWFTYLNSDFKKGGWSPEEDMLLCEAQKIFGNRWTEIAKVVSGRTDNAVKNRFTTLCKKRARNEALAKENSTTSFINLNNKRVIFQNVLSPDGVTETAAAPFKKLRTYASKTTEDCNQEEKFAAECGMADQLPRPPFAVLGQVVHGSEVKFPRQLHVGHIKEASTDGSVNNKMQGTFLKKDNPKVLALIQQAELLSSLAIKVNSENTDQSIESAWTVLQDYLKQNKDGDLPMSRNSDSDFEMDNLKELVEDLSSNGGSRQSSREPDIQGFSPSSSEYSTGSNHLLNVPGGKLEEIQAETCLLHQETRHELQSDQLDDQQCLTDEITICHSAGTNEGKPLLKCNDIKTKDGVVCEYSNTEFSSPLHVTPQFRSLAAAVPSPIFSESEKHFLMKTLGMDPNSPSVINNASQPPPPCKRSLLHCL